MRRPSVIRAGPRDRAGRLLPSVMLLSLLSLVLVSAACFPAVTRVERLEIASERPTDATGQLDGDMGFLLLEVEANARIHRLGVESRDSPGSRFYVDKLQKGRHTYLLKVPAGRYAWHRVEILGYGQRGNERPFVWELDDQTEHLRFEIFAGKLNYPGLLVLERDRSLLYSFTLNRSGELAALMNEKASWLMSTIPSVYTGRRRDDFLEFYSSKLAERARTEPRPHSSSGDALDPEDANDE